MGTKKRDWLPAYRDTINDRWTSLLADIHLLGKERWQYRIPQASAERSTLRDLCRQTLALEKDYLERVRTYLVAELRRNDPVHCEFAKRRMASLPDG